MELQVQCLLQVKLSLETRFYISKSLKQMNFAGTCLHPRVMFVGYYLVHSSLERQENYATYLMSCMNISDSLAPIPHRKKCSRVDFWYRNEVSISEAGERSVKHILFVFLDRKGFIRFSSELSWYLQEQQSDSMWPCSEHH